MFTRNVDRYERETFPIAAQPGFTVFINLTQSAGAIECPADDVAGFADALASLASNESRYAAMVEACDELRNDFLDGRRGLESAIRDAVESLGSKG